MKQCSPSKWVHLLAPIQYVCTRCRQTWSDGEEAPVCLKPDGPVLDPEKENWEPRKSVEREG